MSKPPLLVSVIIVNFNSGDWLRGCVESLGKQTYLPEKIVIFDNCSTDGSTENLISGGVSILIHKGTENCGFAAANNLAVFKYAHSEWVALLNPDTIPHSGWLEALVARAGKTDSAAIGSVLHKIGSPDTLDGYGDAYHSSGLAWRIGHGLPKLEKKLSIVPIFSVCAGAALLKVEVFRELGGFEESFFCYFEDVDYGFRLRLMGYDIEVESDSIVDHFGGGCSGSRSDTALYYGHRNLVWAYIRNMPGYLFWLYLPQHIALNIFSILLGAIRGQGLVIFRAKWHALLGIRRAWSQRQTIQKLAVVSSSAIRQALSKGVRSWVGSRKWVD